MSDLDLEYVKDLESRCDELEKRVAELLDFDPNLICSKIESELWQKNPYRPRPDGTCPGCGTWAPKDHPEAHDHKEGCPAMKEVERWNNLDQRVYDRICDIRAKWTKYRDIY